MVSTRLRWTGALLLSNVQTEDDDDDEKKLQYVDFLFVKLNYEKLKK